MQNLRKEMETKRNSQIKMI
jgi:hypothetical protein